MDYLYTSYNVKRFMSSFFQQRRVVLLHLSFWCVYLSFFLYQITSRRGGDIDWGIVTSTVIIQVAFASVAAYLNYFIFLPRFLKHRNVWRYLAEFTLPFALIMLIRIIAERYFVDGFTGEAEWLYRSRFLVQICMTNLFIVIFVAMLRFAVEWMELEAKKKEVENEKLTAELNFLKAQINPHFLFNTLNNLYYLAYSKSDNTTEVIAKLSQMMRYMIYDSNHAKVLLTKEIEYMLGYISLERLRLNDQVPIKFEVVGSPENLWITPLILITFLENAFKHGVNNSNPKAWVNLSIRLQGKSCIFIVENSKTSESKDVAEKSGIGLRNVRRRLELSYPGRHTLEIIDGIDKYLIKLNLSLE